MSLSFCGFKRIADKKLESWQDDFKLLTGMLQLVPRNLVLLKRALLYYSENITAQYGYVCLVFAKAM